MIAQDLRLSSLIGGAWSAVESDEWTPSLNPTHPDRILAKVPCGSTAEVAAACEAAEDACASWSSLSGPARADHLYRWSEAIKAKGDALAEAIVSEVGKPIGEAKGEVGRCEMILRYFAGEAVREIGDMIPAQSAGSLQFSLRQPLGPVALITPWNFPVAIPLWKAAPALAFGNTVVLKPAEASSFVAWLLAQTAVDAGLPPGVFNVVFGKGSKIGGSLVRNKAVRALSFTGSDAVGLKIAEACASRNLKFQTEMGGKNVAIVLADADLKQAANLVAGGAFRFAGQKCTATSRVVVEKAVYGAFQDALIEAASGLPVGDPAVAATAVGPVISMAAQQQIGSAVEAAPYDRIYRGAAPADGYFVSPTVLGRVAPNAEIAQEELFGPVLAMMEAEDFEHAISLANDTKFGLSAALFSKDIPNALAYIGRIEAGMVRVNGDTTGVDPHAPFGGLKGSSSHSREQGPAAKEFFTELKTVQINP